MKLATKYCGDVMIDPQAIITFPSGIPGFEDQKEFVLIDLPSVESVIFQTLQSVNDSSLAFIVVNPYLLTNAYEFTLDDSTIERLQISDEKEIGVFVIVAVQDPFEQSVLNVKAPLIINNHKRLGKQFIISSHTYETKTPLTSFIQTGVKEDS